MSDAADRPSGKPARWPMVRAPGKVMLAGEYGVLIGAPALVMAVDRHVTIGGDEMSPAGADPADPLLRSLIEEASRHASLPVSPPSFDDATFRTPGGHKLGLGSSAAKAAGLLASAFLLAGEDIGSPAAKQRILDAALRAHRRAGGGSGADVAASVLGGLVRYRVLVDEDASHLFSPSAEEPLHRAHRITLQDHRLPLVVHGAAPLSTRDALGKLAAMLRSEPSARVFLQETARAGEALVDVLEDPGVGEKQVRDVVGEAGRVLRELSSKLGLGSGKASEALEAASSVARGFGGAAKPSGAGAGDLVLVFVPSVPYADRHLVATRLDSVGLHVLNLGLDDHGVRPDGPPLRGPAGRGQARSPEGADLES